MATLNGRISCSYICLVASMTSTQLQIINTHITVKDCMTSLKDNIPFITQYLQFVFISFRKLQVIGQKVNM